MVMNLAPDKQHTSVVNQIMPLMKPDACLAYSHAFNIVEEGMQIRDDLTVIMVAPKCPGTEVREEYKRGFGVPTLIAVHTENDPRGDGLELAKAYAQIIPSKDSTVVIHCRTGHQASQTFLVLKRLLGYRTIFWYDAGWTQWAAKRELPIE